MGLGGLMVAAGGALGAAGRYGISLLPWRGELPLLTLCTNFLGALAIGFVVGLAGSAAFPPAGLCSGRLGCAAALPPSPLFLWRASPCWSGESGFCAGDNVFKRGAVPAGSGPGAEVERGCLNRPWYVRNKRRRLPPPFYFSIFFDMPPNLSWKIYQDWAFLNARIKRSWKAREKTGKD